MGNESKQRYFWVRFNARTKFGKMDMVLHKGVSTSMKKSPSSHAPLWYHAHISCRAFGADGLQSSCWWSGAETPFFISYGLHTDPVKFGNTSNTRVINRFQPFVVCYNPFIRTSNKNNSSAVALHTGCALESHEPRPPQTYMIDALIY